MIPAEFSLLNQLKDSTLPFILILDSNGKVISSGSSLNKIIGFNLEGKDISSYTDFKIPSHFDAIFSLKPNGLIKFHFKNIELGIKASVDFSKGKSHALLFCTPSFNAKHHLSSTNLTINDFSDSSIMAEYIFLMETTNRSMKEAYQSIESINQKNKAIKETNENLELLIQKRTDEVNAKNDDLKNQNEKLYKMALFPAHNPNPVIELDLDMNIIYHNEACKNHPSIYQLLTESHKELEKFHYLLRETIKSKKDGKYTVKEGIKIDGKHYAFKLYIDKEHNFIRLYLTDMTESILLQEELKKQRDEIYDSLNYAKNIQQSILPEEKLFYPFFKNQFFYFNPKDIVSGDFYWAGEKDNQLYFALCDCTGHGVPGALLSMIGYDALNYVLNNDKVTSSQSFMNSLSDFFKNARQSGRLRHNDSMDLIIFKYDTQNKSICYSGSNQKLFIVRDNNLLEFNTDHISLGEDFESVNNSFTEECIKLKEGDVIYTFSDGYVDQFGGPIGKKLKYPKFRKLLLEIHKRPMNQQTILLDEYIEEWKNECIDDPFSQIDDMTIVGFKI